MGKKDFLLNPIRFLLIIPFFLLNACGKPTYPKEKITSSIENIIKKECKLESRAQLVGKTFYLKVALPDLVSTEADIQKVVIKKLGSVNLAISRVSLSSDAKIEYIVMIVDLPGWKTSFNIIQRLDDLKSFLYQKISRGDYEDRIIYDLKSNEEKPAETFTDLSLADFAAKLIVSKFNWLTISNPFLNAALGARLKVHALVNDRLVLMLDREKLSPIAHAFLEKTIMEWSGKVSEKYKFSAIKEINILNNAGTPILDIKVAAHRK